MDARHVRRIVTVDKPDGTSTAIADGPSPDVSTDPARPGYAAARLWVTDRTPCPIKGVTDTLHLPHTLEPPKGGSVCRVVTFPPDSGYRDRIEERHVRAFFKAMGSPHASTYAETGPHPYMQKTNTLDFALVLDGEITLVLDLEEVRLATGDTVVLRGANHAFSNHSDRPCTVAFSSHDGLS